MTGHRILVPHSFRSLTTVKNPQHQAKHRKAIFACLYDWWESLRKSGSVSTWGCQAMMGFMFFVLSLSSHKDPHNFFTFRCSPRGSCQVSGGGALCALISADRKAVPTEKWCLLHLSCCELVLWCFLDHLTDFTGDTHCISGDDRVSTWKV